MPAAPPLAGGCLCGHIRFELTADPGKPHSCSCSMCQKHSGALTLLWVEAPSEIVRWTGPGGRPTLWRSSPRSSRAFCPRCGSTLGAFDDEPVIALVTGVFDKPHLKALKPQGHSFKGSKPRWWHVQVDGET